MRSVTTWMEDYNARAFEAAFGRGPEDFRAGELGDLLAFGLGYVDYSKPSVVKDLLDHRHDTPGPGAIPVDTTLEGSSEEALVQGLEAMDAGDRDETLGQELPGGWSLYGDLDDDEFAGMMAYAIGFIDFDTLAREYPA